MQKKIQISEITDSKYNQYGQFIATNNKISYVRNKNIRY